MEEYKNGIVFYDKSYKTYSELAKAYGVRYDTFMQRLNRGWTIEEALELLPHTHKGTEITLNERVYLSKKEAADSIGVRPDELNNLLNGDEISTTNKKSVVVDGVKYESKAEAQRKLNLKRWQLEAKLEGKPKRSTPVSVFVDDEEISFPSIRQCCAEYNMDYSRTCAKIKNGEATLQELVDKKLNK